MQDSSKPATTVDLSKVQLPEYDPSAQFHRKHMKRKLKQGRNIDAAVFREFKDQSEGETAAQKVAARGKRSKFSRLAATNPLL